MDTKQNQELVFTHKEFHSHEGVYFGQDKASGFKGIIAIHSRKRGPALGGMRMSLYPDESSALSDVLRLAEGMTYKAAAAELKLGGGKMVVLADPKKEKTQALLLAAGRFIQMLSGAYITAEDSGTNLEDMLVINKATKHVVGIKSGDPSRLTAYGTYLGIKACVEFKLGKKELRGLKIAIQGIGNVGSKLAEYLYQDGCQLTVTDTGEEKLKRLKENNISSTFVKPEEIFSQKVEIFSPNARGAILNEQTVSKLKCSIIAGAANNQLSEEKIGDWLYEKEILYAPDYIINAGGLINVYMEVENPNHYDDKEAHTRCEPIYGRLKNIFAESEKKKIPPYKIAKELALKNLK